MGLGPKAKSKSANTDGNTADTKDKGESELARLQAVLERKKFLYEQDALNHGQFLQFSKEQEAAFWAENLNDAALNSKDKQKVDKLYFEARRAVMLEGHKQELAKMEGSMQAFKNDAQRRLNIAIELEGKAGSPTEKQKFRDMQTKILAEIQQDQEKADVVEIATRAKHEAALLDMARGISGASAGFWHHHHQQYLDGMKRIEEQKYQIEIKGLQDRQMEMLLAGDKRKEEVAKVNGEIQALEDKHQKTMISLGNQQAALNRQKDGWAGWAEGIRDALKQTQNTFMVFKQAATQVLSGITNAFSTGIQGMLTGQMSLHQGMRAIWQGIVQTVAQAVAQMVAQWLVAKAAQAAFGVASTSQAVATATAETSASLTAGAAGAWEAYGWIPYVGAGLAIAQIAAMEASVAAVQAVPIVAHAVGGIIDRPTLALMGEAGERELVSPETSFKDFAATLASNILSQERQAQGYGRQAASFASAAPLGLAGSTSASPSIINVHMNGPTFDTSQRGLRTLGAHIIDAGPATGGERNQILAPGQVFPGL